MRVAIQLAWNIISSGCGYGVIGVAFALMYSVTGFMNMSLGALYVVAPYSSYALTGHDRRVTPSIFLIGVAAAAAVGALLDFSIFRTLRKRGATPLSALLAGFGVFTVLVNLLALIFGDDSKSIWAWPIREGFRVAGGRITLLQVITISTSLILMLSLLLLLRFTAFGLIHRAVANDHELAVANGLHVERVLLWSTLIASFLAGAAGLFRAMELDLAPYLGYQGLLKGLIAALIATERRPIMAFLGGFVVAAIEQVSGFLAQADWQDAYVFLLLVLLLLVRPTRAGG